MGLGVALSLGSAPAFADGVRARVVRIGGAPDSERTAHEHPLGRDEEVPPHHHLEERPRKAPIYAGIGVGLAGYLFSALYAPFMDQGGYALVPVFGPWIWLAADHPEREGHVPDVESVAPGVMVFTGLAQTTGIVLVLIGVGSTRKWVVRGDPDTASKVFVLPRVGPHSAGLSLGGAF